MAVAPEHAKVSAPRTHGVDLAGPALGALHGLKRPRWLQSGVL